MIEKITLHNYRCFEKTELSFKDLTVIVGKNNAGKSTLIEAIRISSMVTKKYKTSIYIQPPESLRISPDNYGFRIPVERLKIDLRGVVYFYTANTNAKIEVLFDNKCRLIVYLNEEVAFATIQTPERELIVNKSMAKKYSIETIGILPQIGLIKEVETKLTELTIKKDLDTYLSSRHFRNELLLFKDKYYDFFKELAEQTWPTLRIRDLIWDPLSNEISFLIEDLRFTAEIGLMGSGIQMWLQIIWSICKSNESDVIILDEPDVYMHPEMQTKVLRLVKIMYKQIIIATHSIEIISNVAPKNIVMIDKSIKKMRYANKLPVAQNIINDIGSNYNLALAQINESGKCIFVEGKDMRFLRKFYDILYPDDFNSFYDIPHLPLGGFCNINEAYGASKLFQSNTQGAFKCYAILDSDYYSDDYINAVKAKAKNNYLLLYVLKKKELENYLLNPKLLHRIVGSQNVGYDSFVIEFEKIVDTNYEHVLDSYATKFQEEDRGLTAGSASNKARNFLKDKWETLDDKLLYVPGKQLLKDINKWLKRQYNIQCSINTIFENTKIEDIDDEITSLLSDIINN